MKMEEIMEKAFENAGINKESLLEKSYEAFKSFAELNNLDESEMFKSSDAGGVPIFCFDGTIDDLFNMKVPDGYSIAVDLKTGLNAIEHDIRIFG